MTAEVTPAYVKGLFFHAVRLVGGVDAAGAYLGVSKQRVSVLQSVNHDDMPTVLQIATLERAIGQDVVTGPLSRAATGKPDTGNVLDEVMDAHEALAEVQRKARAGAPHREFRAAAIALTAEVDQLSAAVDNSLPH